MKMKNKMKAIYKTSNKNLTFMKEDEIKCPGLTLPGRPSSAVMSAPD